MSETAARIEMGILIIDDEPAVLRTIGDHLSTRGHRIYTATGGPEGLEILKRDPVDIVITDVKMPGMDGFEVLREVKRSAPGAEVIMVTAFGDIEVAVQAMREGAFDFFTKPVKMRDLTASLQRTLRFQALRREKDRYRERLERIGEEARQQYGLSAIIGESPPIRKVKALIEQVCRTDATTVLISGEIWPRERLWLRRPGYTRFEMAAAPLSSRPRSRSRATLPKTEARPRKGMLEPACIRDRPSTEQAAQNRAACSVASFLKADAFRLYPLRFSPLSFGQSPDAIWRRTCLALSYLLSPHFHPTIGSTGGVVTAGIRKENSFDFLKNLPNFGGFGNPGASILRFVSLRL